MPRSELTFETMKETGENVLNEPKRSSESMPKPTTAPTLADTEIKQYSSLFDFDAASMFDPDSAGQVTEDFDQSNAIGSNPNLNTSSITTNEKHPIVTSSASANEPRIEQNVVDKTPAEIPSLEDFEWSQEQQDDFLNTLNGIGSEEISSWYANAVVTQGNSDALSEQNIEQILEFTDENQAILDSFRPTIANEISMKYLAQNELSITSSQSSGTLTAQDAVLQGSEQLGGTSNTDILEDPTSSSVKPEDKVTKQDRLNVFTKSTEKESPASILNFDQYDKFFFPAQSIPSSPMNHDENTTRNHQGSTSQSPTKIRESEPVMSVQQLEMRQNEVGAAQNRFEQNLLGGREKYSRVTEMQMQNEDDQTHAPPPHQYLDAPYGNFNTAQAPQPYPCFQASGNVNLRAGFVMQRAGNGPGGVENGVYNTRDVASQSSENYHGSKTNKDPKKRPSWETRPDATRPRVRMTEEEFQWLRPNEGPRDVFENQRKKAAEQRLKDEAEANALEKAGMPRPQPKEQKKFKGGVHIEVWEKESLNNRRRAQGKSGRELFLEKPKLRGKRKGREISGAETQPDSKKLKLEESNWFALSSETRGVNEGLTHDTYASSMPVIDGFNRGMSNDPYSNASPMTSQMNQGITSSGPTYNSNINNNYGDIYGNNNYIGIHYTDPSLGSGAPSSGMTRNGALDSMPAYGAAYPSMGQSSRPEYDGPHQTRAVYSHNQHLGSFHSQSEQKARVSYGRSNVPSPPNLESMQKFGNFQPQFSQRSAASIYGTRKSTHQVEINLANPTMANGGNSIPSYLSGQNAQVLRSNGHVYPQDILGGMRSISNSLIDPMLQSQAQFPVPSVMGTQTRERTSANYEYVEDFEDLGTQERSEH
ncbi:hypothetical protein BCIN_06g00200 [Botrytis cinerea B05.10]|uniref:Uncharacterized protein n=2 Tax=Botryotinia fuckeliana TaxID=40559 RepID=A0A384JIU9_BOTFB|nr:hypothetical protein BCIN_06g00200 [Botrytis cinerea B05.10]ATZ50518.1 hypothetical protein BCIN_06g00200 [Botrytis cinerea B05.10]CCD49336.1 hypothetical protein BofuT4_P032120.1 [Botrytis cinerea T4]